VFPLQGKRPYPSTRGFKDATTDFALIESWWDQWPEANVGIRCDSETGPIVVDIDGPSGAALMQTLALPSTRLAGSRKGRQHLYFNPMEDGTRIARMIRPMGKEHAFDILGDGGYVVAPPSVHPETRRRYTWTSIEKLAPFPRAILRMVRKHTDIQKIAPPLPDIIDEGQRDTLLTSLAGTARRRGASEEGILAMLREENASRVRPPLPDRALVRISKSIAKKEPVAVPEHFTAMGNARPFVADHAADLRSTSATRTPWWIWDTTRWIPDDMGEAQRRAKRTIHNIHTLAAQINDEELQEKLIKHAMTSESAGSIRAMLELAATEKEVLVRAEQFNANPMLLNVRNGTLDLKTGKLLPHNRKHLISKMSKVEYQPNAHAPRWEQFLMEIMAGDVELVEFLRRAVGYSLTGDTREQCLFFCYGQGANGKSTFLETLRKLLNDYSQAADFNSFMTKSGDGPRTDIARMRGARFVTANEASNRDFDARTVQQLTGDDTVVARHLYEREFEFRPQHKLWLAANHKPVVKEQTEAFWRRMRLIPFTVVFPPKERDKMLSHALAKELPGILAWAMAGCLEWQRNGLLVPKAIRKATLAYKDENDMLGEFFSHSCRIAEDAWTPTALLYRAFLDWWQETRGTRSQPPSGAWFGRLLNERPALKQIKNKHVRGWRGLSLRMRNPISGGD
jgi:putative DNA primase/helicase